MVLRLETDLCRMPVCFFGADGSGKSSLARLYAALLSRKGCRPCIAWMRGSHTFVSIVARLLRLFPSMRGDCNPYYGICIPRSLARAWVWLEFMAALPVVVARYLFPRLLGCTIVGERGLYDFLVWLVVTLRYPRAVSSLPGRLVLSLAKGLCVNVYVRAEADVLLERRRGELEEGTLRLQLAVYDLLARWAGAPVVDTSRSRPVDSLAAVLERLRGKRG